MHHGDDGHEATVPALPGAVGVTHLTVYATPAPDGLAGGSPHLHLACTEAYVAIAGRGAVQTLGPAGFAELPLEAGRLVWFSPGVIHRLINLDGRLEILVIMGNAGLPEAGDFVLTFPPDVLADPAAYRSAAAMSAGGRVYASGDEAARARRDLSVEGFAILRERHMREGRPALEAFYRAAVALVGSKLDDWHEVWTNGPLAAAERTGEDLAALRAGSIEGLLRGQVAALPAPPTAPDDERKLGMCGTLGLYLPEGAPQGSKVEGRRS